jgi:hypothetical protein
MPSGRGVLQSSRKSLDRPQTRANAGSALRIPVRCLIRRDSVVTAR